MQIFSKTVKFDGTENADIVLAVKCTGVVFLIENRGPATIHISDIGPVSPEKFLVIGDVDEVAIHPPGQFTTVDINAYLRP